MQKRNMFRGLMAAATVSMVAACAPTGTPTTPGTPTSSPTASPSVTPTAGPTDSPVPTDSPSTTPTASPSATPSATTSPDGSASPSPTATPSATTSPSASPTSGTDISVVESTTFNGKVYDDEGSPLNGVTVKVKSLNSAQPYEATTTTAGGTYAFNNAPSGVQLEITASRSGYTTRRRVEVLKSNKEGDPNANRYDFGTEDGVDGEAGDFGIGYNGLSDKPEVVAVTPGRNASGVAPDTSFVVKFSEGMDTDTVEDNFAIYAATTELLSVDLDDGGVSALTGLDDDPDGAGDAATFVGVEGSDATDGETPDEAGATLVFDDSDFDISWNSDDTEVTFTFADEAHLPTDTESADVPDYLVTFNGVDDGQLKDKSGVTRDEGDEGYFKLTDGDFEMWYDFSIDTDEEEPTVEAVEATDDEADLDEISVEFSEPMMLNTRAGQIMGLNSSDAPGSDTGDGETSESPLDADNYEVGVVFSGDSGEPDSFETLFNLDDINGGFNAEGNELETVVSNIRFDSDDDTNSTVLIQIGDDDDDGLDNSAFAAGDRVFVRVNRSVVDPAGNSVDSSNDEEDDTAN